MPYSGNRISSLLAGVFMVAAGVFILMEPKATIAAFSLILGVLALILAAFLFFLYLQLQEGGLKKSGLLFLSLLLFFLGLLFFFQPLLSATIFSYILAIWFIIEGVMNLRSLAAYRSLGAPFFGAALGLGLLLLAGGILLLFQPLLAGITLSLVLGAALLLSGIQRIFSSLALRD